uniref:Nicotinamidase 1 n=1 Tax=Zea mays TaxID=4577 RepID=A0A804PHL5_MAIZE
MGTEADAAAVDLLRSQIPFQIDGEFVLPPRDVRVVLVDLCNGFCTVGAGNLVEIVKEEAG